MTSPVLQYETMRSPRTCILSVARNPSFGLQTCEVDRTGTSRANEIVGAPRVPSPTMDQTAHPSPNSPDREEGAAGNESSGARDAQLAGTPRQDALGADSKRKAAERERAREDHEFIRRAQEGDEDAFSALVHRHERRAWRIARNMVPSNEDAQDLAQEAFLRVFRNLERFDFQHDFTTWLYRIVTNLAIDHLRKRRPTISMSGAADEDEADIDMPDPREERPSDRIQSKETMSEVQACLSTLAPHFQSVLQLRELEGLACTEIADIVGATHVTVRWRLHRGRKLFQDEWERRARMTGEKAGQLLAQHVLRGEGLLDEGPSDLQESAEAIRESGQAESENNHGSRDPKRESKSGSNGKGERP